MTNFSEYIISLRTKGQYTFTLERVMVDLGISYRAARSGVLRLKEKGQVVSPIRQLYVIVPPEYRALGCLPAEEIVPLLMEYWDLSYYVCLLSAAYYHGASHQKPQIFQVMTTKQLQNIRCGRIQINFINKKSLTKLSLVERVVKTGYLSISSPELTAQDLLQHIQKAGGLNAVATVLSELLESIDAQQLREVFKQSVETAWIQRFGYILSHIDSMNESKRHKLITLAKVELARRVLRPVPLASELPTKGMPRDEQWKIIENTNIESDL